MRRLALLVMLVPLGSIAVAVADEPKPAPVGEVKPAPVGEVKPSPAGEGKPSPAGEVKPRPAGAANRGGKSIVPPPPVTAPSTQQAAASEPVPAPVERGYSLDDLGLGREVRRDTGRGSVTLSLPTRADWVLTSAKLTVVFAGRTPDPMVTGIEVLVNDEHVGTYDAAQIEKTGIGHAIEIDPAFLGDHNTLTLRFIRAAVGACEGRVPPGSWDMIAHGQLDLRAAPLKMANDLALLPLPFTDTQFGSDASVPIAFLTQPNPSELRAAALVASWFGLRSGSKLRFPVTIGELPAGDVIVLVDDPEVAARLGMPAPTGPLLQMIDWPSGTAMRKLLVVGGRNAAEATLAATALAQNVPLSGSSMKLSPTPPPPPVPIAPYDAPRWVVAGERVPLALAPGAAARELQGAGGGTIRLELRLPPDLFFFWQAQHPELDIAWSATMPAWAHSPRVTVEMDGKYIGVVPVAHEEHGQAFGHRKLPLNIDTLPGYNEILIHVDYGRMPCGAEAAPAHFTLDPDSALLLGAHPTHFATYPNLELFVDDGFPFTRVPDLSETAAIMAARPAPGEIETLLTAVAHFAAVTGRAGTGLVVLGPDELEAATGRDLLVVGAADNNPMVGRWRERLPLMFDHGRPFAQLPDRTRMQVLLSWLAARDASGEATRAEEITSQDPGLAAVMGIESPLDEGRSAILLTAATDARMPRIRDLQGPAVSGSREADLLVASHGALWMFRLGPSYQVGKLDSWRRLLVFLSMHWVALFPFILLGTVMLAVVLRAALRFRVRVRDLQIGSRS